MARRKSTRLRISPPGTFDGAKITFADTDQIDAHEALATEFMQAIFELGPGEYLITDEADLMGFAPFDECDTDAIWARIAEVFGVKQSDVGSELLVKILDAIQARRSVQ